MNFIYTPVAIKSTYLINNFLDTLYNNIFKTSFRHISLYQIFIKYHLSHCNKWSFPFHLKKLLFLQETLILQTSFTRNILSGENLGLGIWVKRGRRTENKKGLKLRENPYSTY